MTINLRSYKEYRLLLIVVTKLRLLVVACMLIMRMRACFSFFRRPCFPGQDCVTLIRY